MKIDNLFTDHMAMSGSCLVCARPAASGSFWCNKCDFTLHYAPECGHGMGAIWSEQRKVMQEHVKQHLADLRRKSPELAREDFRDFVYGIHYYFDIWPEDGPNVEWISGERERIESILREKFVDFGFNPDKDAEDGRSFAALLAAIRERNEKLLEQELEKFRGMIPY